MSNKKQFKDNLNARVRIRPLIYYANLDKHLDEEWLIEEIQNDWFRIKNHGNGYFVIIGRDAIREWVDDFSKQDGLKRGTIVLKVQITLRDGDSHPEPLTDSMLAEAMKRDPERR